MKFCSSFSLVLNLFERTFAENLPYTLFYKNIVYKSIQAHNHPIFKNIIRILLSLSLHICVSFCLFCDACFAMFITENQ